MAKLITICAWCEKKLGSSNEPSLKEDAISHGMCEKCAEKQRKELEKLKAGCHGR